MTVNVGSPATSTGARHLKKSRGHLLGESAQIFGFIDEHRTLWSVEEMCRVLSVSRSGYYSRRAMVVGWVLSSSLGSQMVQAALHRAIQRRRPGAGLIIHSDRGVQYACNNFRKMLDKHSFIQSMSRKGNCWDNAVAESFFSIIKSEMIHHEHFKGRNDTLPAVFEYIEVYYNRKRKHSTLGYRTPAQIDQTIKSGGCL